MTYFSWLTHNSWHSENTSRVLHINPLIWMKRETWRLKNFDSVLPSALNENAISELSRLMHYWFLQVPPSSQEIWGTKGQPQFVTLISNNFLIRNHCAVRTGLTNDNHLTIVKQWMHYNITNAEHGPKVFSLSHPAARQGQTTCWCRIFLWKNLEETWSWINHPEQLWEKNHPGRCDIFLPSCMWGRASYSRDFHIIVWAKARTYTSAYQ